MKYRNLGRTGLKVSTICLGCLEFGRKLEEAESIPIVKSALEAGINFFDTANVYGNGKSESVVGKALQGERHNVVLATKVGVRLGPGVNDGGLSRKHIMQSVENSLRNLRTDYIDLYYAHSPDYTTPMEETLRAFGDLVHQGKVRYIGISNYFAWQLCKALWLSDKYNLARCDCIQPAFNLIARDAEVELLPLCADEGVGVCVWVPLAGGMLTGKYNFEQSPPDNTKLSISKPYYKNLWHTANFEAVTRLKEIADGHGVSLAQFALAWVLHQPAITANVCGATSAKQVEENAKGVDVTLSEEELAACDEVWKKLSPRPGMIYARGPDFKG